MKLILLFITFLPTTCFKKTYQLIFPQSHNFSHAILHGTIDHPLTDYTLCHWINVNAEFNWATIFSYETDALERSLVTWLGSKGNYELDENNELQLLIESGMNTFSWLHWCVTSSRLRGTWNIFFNGVSINSGIRAPKNPIPPNGRVVLGQRATKSEKFNIYRSLQGSIADVYMWDYILSPQEVARVYACNFSEEANVISWNLHSWQPFNGARISSVRLPCGL